MKRKIKNILATIVMIVAIIVSFWLAINILLVGGVMQAIVGFQTMDAGMAAWGIVRALLFEMGFIPFWLGMFVAVWLTD